MRVLETDLTKYIIKSYELEIGKLYLFENLAISEINQGKHLSINTSDDYLSVLSEFYGENKPFGYISNRVNSFSIAAIDFPIFLKVLKNLKIFSTVSYTHFDEINVEVEQQFCKLPYNNYKTLKVAYQNINEYIKNDLSNKSLKNNLSIS